MREMRDDGAHDHVLDAQRWIVAEVEQSRPVGQAKLGRDRALLGVDVDQQHLALGVLGDAAGEVEGGEALALARAGGGDHDHVGGAAAGAVVGVHRAQHVADGDAELLGDAGAHLVADHQPGLFQRRHVQRRHPRSASRDGERRSPDPAQSPVGEPRRQASTHRAGCPRRTRFPSQRRLRVCNARRIVRARRQSGVRRDRLRSRRRKRRAPPVSRKHRPAERPRVTAPPVAVRPERSA